MSGRKALWIGELYAPGGLISLSGQSTDLRMECRLPDGRELLIGFNIKNGAEFWGSHEKARARRMRTLASTLLAAANRLDPQ